MKIQLVSIENTGVVHLAMEGKITSADFTDTNANPLETTLGAGWAGNRVLLDLSRVSYVDSAAIGWLLRVQKGFKSVGGSLALFGISPGVMQIFTLLNLRSVFKLAETETAARSLLAPQAV